MYREDGVAEETYTQAVLGRIEKRARAALGDDQYDALVGTGEDLSRDEAIKRGRTNPRVSCDPAILGESFLGPREVALTTTLLRIARSRQSPHQSSSD